MLPHPSSWPCPARSWGWAPCSPRATHSRPGSGCLESRTPVKSLLWSLVTLLGTPHLVSDAAGAGHHQVVLAPRVEDPVEPPHLPGLRDLLCHEAAALQPLLGQVPGPGHGGLGGAGVITPDVGDHLGLDGVHHLGPEDVGEHPAHQADHEQEEGEHNVGEEETLDLLVTRWMWDTTITRLKTWLIMKQKVVC